MALRFKNSRKGYPLIFALLRSLPKVFKINGFFISVVQALYKRIAIYSVCLPKISVDAGRYPRADWGVITVSKAESEIVSGKGS